jgi:hypothetical protein
MLPMLFFTLVSCELIKSSFLPLFIFLLKFSIFCLKFDIQGNKFLVLSLKFTDLFSQQRSLLFHSIWNLFRCLDGVRQLQPCQFFASIYKVSLKLVYALLLFPAFIEMLPIFVVQLLLTLFDLQPLLVPVLRLFFRLLVCFLESIKSLV